MLKKLFSIVLLVMPFLSPAQEFNCKVKIMRDKIQGVDKQIFNGMESAITEFLNARKWTNEQFGVNEKIDCNVMINLTKKVSDDTYAATINIQASRPVYNTNYTSLLINYIDRDFAFKFSPFVPVQFDDNRISGNDPMASNLTAVLAYYMYMILGLDYDSFKLNGGTDYYKKAQNIVTNAPEQGKEIAGWRAVEDTKNRYWIVDQMLSPRFVNFRTNWYHMHREGLDNMYSKPDSARKAVLEGIPKLSQMQRENPGSILLQFFFNAKSDEIIGIMSQVPREQRAPFITMLQQMDVPNAQKYANLSK